MSYVRRVLQPGETVRHAASLYWIVFLPGASFLTLAIALLIYAEFLSRYMLLWQLIAGLVGVIGILLLIPEWWSWWTTEIAVTDRRVVYKVRLLALNPVNFLRVQTNEMQMDRIESVQVDQPLLGQMLGYGDVTILGTGSGGEPVKNVANPIELRNQISAADRSHDQKPA
jgi:uncharacterized membrane protein YdbT with pleckstrin-like domain